MHPGAGLKFVVLGACCWPSFHNRQVNFAYTPGLISVDPRITVSRTRRPPEDAHYLEPPFSGFDFQRSLKTTIRGAYSASLESTVSRVSTCLSDCRLRPQTENVHRDAGCHPTPTSTRLRVGTPWTGTKAGSPVSCPMPREL